MDAATEVIERGPAAARGDLRGATLAGLPVEDRRMELAGVSTAVLEGGPAERPAGPPVVLLHGAGEFAATWRRVIPGLTRTRYVVAPDLPGHGGSEAGEEPLDVERVLAWLEELVDRTCEDPPVLVGHLLGGSVALRFAARRPDRVDRLVLVDTFGLGWLLPSPRFALAMIGFVARPTERSQERLFRLCMADLDALRDDMDGRMEALEAYALERARGPVLKDALGDLMPKLGVRPIPSDELERIAVPTSLIWGRDDLQVPLRVAEAASERYGWPLHVIDGARDDPAIERPEAFLAALRVALGEAAGA